MSASAEEYPTLSLQFDEYLKLYEEIESSDLPTISEILQTKIQKAVESLEKTTFMVSEIGLFSENEIYEEIPTQSLKFLLLPAFLGSLALKNLSIPREEALRLSRIYFLNYLKRCKDYDLTNVCLDIFEDTSDSEENATKILQKKCTKKSGPPSVQELQEMSKQREDKLNRYRAKKSLEEQLKQLKIRLDKADLDDDILRDYYISLLKKTVHQSLEELDNILMEINMLTEIAKMKKDGLPLEPVTNSSEKKSFKPFLLTKTVEQKRIFGLGYPSLPQMSVEEFYDKRVKEGWFPGAPPPDSCSSGSANHSHSEAPAPVVKRTSDDEEDPNELASLRERDEWRDTHRAGWGNRYNRS